MILLFDFSWGHLINYATVLARLYISFVTGINLGSCVVLWVNLSGISPPFSSSFSLASRYCSVLFHLLSAWLARLNGVFSTINFRLLLLSLVRSLLPSSCLPSVRVNSYSRIFSFTFVLWKHFIKSGPTDKKATKIYLTPFWLWQPCCRCRRRRVRRLTRPRAIPLAIITMRKSIHGLPLLPYLDMALHLAVLCAAGVPLW